MLDGMEVSQSNYLSHFSQSDDRISPEFKQIISKPSSAHFSHKHDVSSIKLYPNGRQNKKKLQIKSISEPTSLATTTISNNRTCCSSLISKPLFCPSQQIYFSSFLKNRNDQILLPLYRGLNRNLKIT